MSFIRKWCKTVIEKPIVYSILLISIIMSVLISCTFYRMAKMQLSGLDSLTSTFYTGNSIADNSALYDGIIHSNILDIEDRTAIEFSFEGNDNIAQISIEKKYFPENDGFTLSELNSREAIAIISTEYSEKFSCNIGDIIELGGVGFRVIRKNLNTTDINISASVKTDIIKNSIEIFPSFVVKSKGTLDKYTQELLNEASFVFNYERGFDVSALVPVFLGILVMSISALNILVAYNYIQKRNTKLYIIYKTVGAKNRTIAFIMTFEMVIVVVIAFLIGIGLEYPIATPLTAEYFGKLTFADYAALFFINIGAVLLTLIYKIIQISRAKPADKRLIGGR